MQVGFYIPGLFGPEAQFSGEYVPAAPTLEFFLSRSDREPRNPRYFCANLWALSGHELPGANEVPAAAVARLADSAGPHDGWWLRADPVHLAADRAGLTLVDPGRFPLSRHDALALAADLRELLESTGAELEVPAARRWYLRFERAPGILTRELDEVSGRDIGSRLPAGPGAETWHRLLNEIQMQLHEHEVNRERGSRGEPAINSLWFWGGGSLPAPVPLPWDSIHGGGVFAEGLARLGGAEHGPCPEALFLGDGGARKRRLFVLDMCRAPARYRDLEGWARAVTAIEKHWIAPALNALHGGEIRSLAVFGDRDVFQLSQPGRLRFWRRNRPLYSYVTGAKKGSE